MAEDPRVWEGAPVTILVPENQQHTQAHSVKRGSGVQTTPGIRSIGWRRGGEGLPRPGSPQLSSQPSTEHP